MELKFLKQEKHEVEVELPSLTLAESLRVYLNKESDVTFAAWKREHMTKLPVLRVKTKDKDVKTAVKAAVEAIEKDLNAMTTEFKSL
ncbi:MAG: hypothetical protein PF542_06100 [Nanoarchaeota archaeon]|jgi:DNA-directed RNA polymerase subunit L|nr:hypothetical protein [Nanoarchaeota archaeon]